MTTEGMRFQISLTIASSAGTAYFATPYRCVLRDVRVTAQAAATGSSITAIAVTAKKTDNSGNTLGVSAFSVSSGAVAGGAASVYTPDGSNGSSVLAAGTPIYFAGAGSGTTVGLGCLVDVELDPFARKL